MIAYDLQCANGHAFEGWFEDGQAYEKQDKKGLIACPVCNDTSVSRIPSTFAIKSSPSEKDFYKQQTDLADNSKKFVTIVMQIRHILIVSRKSRSVNHINVFLFQYS